MKKIILVPLGATHGQNTNEVFKAPLHAEAVEKVIGNLSSDIKSRIAKAFVDMSGEDYLDHVRKALKIAGKENLFSKEVSTNINSELNNLSSENCPSVSSPFKKQSFNLKSNSDFIDFSNEAKQKGHPVMLISMGDSDSATPIPNDEDFKNMYQDGIVVLSKQQAKIFVDNKIAKVFTNHEAADKNLKKSGIRTEFKKGEKLVNFFK